MHSRRSLALLLMAASLSACAKPAPTDSSMTPAARIIYMYRVYSRHIIRGDLRKAGMMAQSVLMMDMKLEAMGRHLEAEFGYRKAIGHDRASLLSLMHEAVRVSAASSSEGPCDYPDDVASDGSFCGDRAASVRPGGRLGPY